MAIEYGTSLGIPTDTCYTALTDLQTCALENLKQKNRYKESGIASIKVKVLNLSSPPRMLTQECLLSALGMDLKNNLAGNLNVPLERFDYI